MTAETTDAVPWPGQGSRRARRAVRPAVGVLADGTPQSVAAHLRAHGWTKAAYCETFGLERGQALEAQETRKRRSASFAARLIVDPAIRAGSAAGRQHAATGELSEDAARASTGRPLPEQRRRKAARAAAAVRQGPTGRDGPRWLQAVTALGFADETVATTGIRRRTRPAWSPLRLAAAGTPDH